ATGSCYGRYLPPARLRDARVAGDRATVQPLVLLDDDVAGERAGTVPCRPAHGREQAGVRQDGFDSRGSGLLVARMEEDSRTAVCDDLRQPADARSDHGNAACERLEGRQ